MVELADIEQAAARIGHHARRTPLLSSPFIDELAGRRVWVKAECLQHTGSFKFRGAWSAISALDKAAQKRGVIAYSSGNHAQGVALAARLHGARATIVMPADAPIIKIENTRALGAQVVLYDRIGGERREDVAARVNADGQLALIAPFDNAAVIAGQATAGLEIAEQAAEQGISHADVLVCCGGGGLTAGVALALAEKAPKMRVRPVEPIGFDDVARSLISGEIETNAHVTGSACDAIITPSPGEMTFPILKRLCGAGLIVSEEEAFRAMALAYERLRIVVEPGGAVALAAAIFHPDKSTGQDVIAIATGANVDRDLYMKVLSEFGGGA